MVENMTGNDRMTLNHVAEGKIRKAHPEDYCLSNSGVWCKMPSALNNELRPVTE